MTHMQGTISSADTPEKQQALTIIHTLIEF